MLAWLVNYKYRDGFMVPCESLSFNTRKWIDFEIVFSFVLIFGPQAKYVSPWLVFYYTKRIDSNVFMIIFIATVYTCSTTRFQFSRWRSTVNWSSVYKMFYVAAKTAGNSKRYFMLFTHTLIGWTQNMCLYVTAQREPERKLNVYACICVFRNGE